MRTTVQGPDGGYITVEHPEGATDGEILAFARENYKPTPVEIGVGGLPQAIKETLPNFNPLSKAAMGAYSAVDQAALRLKQLFGGGLTPQDEAAVVANRALLRESPAALAGNIGMNVFATKGIAPAGVAGSAVLGGAIGAAEPTLGEESALKNAASGALFGAGGNVAGRTLARLILPNAVGRAAPLLEEGIVPTPGQTLGGAAKRAEEGLTSVPLVGDAIRSGQRSAVEQFNRAAINRALAPIGKKLEGPVGHEAVAKAGDMVSQAYDDLLPKLRGVADQQFVDDLVGVRQLAQNLPKDRAAQFNNILKNEVVDKFTSSGLASGETIKAIESKLGGLVRRYGQSLDGDQRLLGDALREVQGSLREMVQRANPEHAGELAKVNLAYANLLRVENAAGRVGSGEGVFSPEALRGATRALDSSLRKRSFSRGEALMQDLARRGVDVLGNKVPDSGTPFRALMAAGPLGLGVGLASSPLGLLYTRAGRQTLATLLARRPEAAAPIASGARAVGRLAPAVGPSLRQLLPD